MHMFSGVDICKDAVDAARHLLSPRDADPVAINLLDEVLDEVNFFLVYTQCLVDISVLVHANVRL